MKKYIFGCLLTLATLFIAMPDVMAQPIKLHEQPESAVPNDDDACYSQERTGVDGKKYFLKFKFKNLKRYFGLKTGAGQLNYIPAATGNPAGDCNKIVLGSNGKQYIIDALGNATQIQAGANYTAGAGITINGGAISAKDTSATNELQVLSLSASGDSVKLNRGGGAVKLPTAAAQVNSNWTATSGVAQVLNKPQFNQGLQQVGDSIQLGGYINSKRHLSFASGNDGGELLLEGGKAYPNKYDYTKFPLRIFEQYDPNNNANYQKGIGLHIYTKDTTFIEPEINSAIYNFDGAMNIQTDQSINMQSNYANVYGSGGVVFNTATGSSYLGNDNLIGFMKYELSNGSGSGLVSTMEYKGGIGNDSYLRLSNYPRTRIDTSEIKNFLYTNTTGTVCSKPISALASQVNGSVNNGLTNTAGATGLGGTTTTPATINSQRQIDFLPNPLGGVPAGQLILKEGHKSNVNNNFTNISYPLLLSTDKINNGTDGVGLLFKNSTNSTNVFYDDIYSHSGGLTVKANGLNRGLGFLATGNIYFSAKSYDFATYDTLGVFRQYNTPFQTSTVLSKNGYLIRNQSDTLVCGKVSGYPTTNNYLQVSNYPKTRNDAGVPVNVLTTDARGVVQSHPVSELPGSSNSTGTYDMSFYYNGNTTTSKAHYVKIGNTVTVSFSHNFYSLSSFYAASITNLPFIPSTNFADETMVKGNATVCNRHANNTITTVSAVLVRASPGQKVVTIDWTATLGNGQNALIAGQFSYEIVPSY